MAAYLKVSAVRNLVKSKGKRCSKDFIEAVDREVNSIVLKAIATCKAMTLKGVSEA